MGHPSKEVIRRLPDHTKGVDPVGVEDQSPCEGCQWGKSHRAESLPSYSAQEAKWETFKEDVLKYFDADRDDKKYKVKNLEAYVLQSRKKSTVKSLGTWRKYTRNFLTISGWLKKNERISQDEENLYFWKGIPRAFRTILEPRLLASQPTYDLSKPFAMAQVNTKAEALLQRNRFDADRLPSDDESSDDDSDSESESQSSDSSSESSESESDKSKRKSKSSKKKKLTKRKTSSKKDDPDLSEDETPTLKRANAIKRKAAKDKKQGEEALEDLVRQMNHMSLSDPEYGILYLKACRMDPLVASVVRPPMIAPTQPVQAAQPLASTPVPPAPPSSMPPPNRAANPPPSRADMKCFGCGATGHGINNCQTIIDLVSQGVVARDAAGRLVMKDGSRIYRGMDEPFVTAIQRQASTATSHFVTTSPTYCTHATIEECSETEAAESDQAESESEEAFSFPAQRADKTSREARKNAAKGPLVPPTQAHEKVTKPGPASTGRDKPPHMENWQHQVPIETVKQEFDPNNDDVIMEDSDLEERPSAAKKNKASNAKSETHKRVPRQNQVQAQVDQWQLLGKVLSTPVTLQVGEVFGMSKEMSHHLQEVLKPAKSPAANKNVVATAFIPRTKGILIHLRMEIDDKPIMAIIDTGSQLNIASRRTWKTLIHRPMDVARSCNMNDANGGAGTLRGLVENVPLRCGGALTWANLYIGDKVPFDLLLGRPWQRGNYVSIDERGDGTYLQF
ncbi:hypothetical protein FOMPIDRAFT_1122500, partial [Fomitopsis schrenkii]